MKCEGPFEVKISEKLMTCSELGPALTRPHTAPAGFYGSLPTCPPDKTRGRSMRFQKEAQGRNTHQHDKALLENIKSIFQRLTLMKEYRVFPYAFRNSALMSNMSISALATIVLIRTLSVVPSPWRHTQTVSRPAHIAGFPLQFH